MKRDHIKELLEQQDDKYQKFQAKLKDYDSCLKEVDPQQDHTEGEPAVYLSGNGPLVAVLTKALARDNYEKCKSSRIPSLTLLEHESARWLPADDMRQIKWLPADIEVVEAIENSSK